MEFQFQMPSFPVLTTFIVFVLMLLNIWNKKFTADRCKNPPPGPWSLPLIGNVHHLAGHQPHHRLTEMAKTYGPIMRFQLGQVSAVIISSAETAKQVMKTQEIHFVGRPSLLAADIMLYNRSDISFAPYGDYWRQMKKIAVLELLSAKRVQSFKPIMEEEVSNFIKSLYLKAELPVNLSRTLCALGNSIIAIIAIGKKFKKQEEFLRVIDKAIRAAGGFSIADAFPSFKLLHMISDSTSTLHKAHQHADRILEEVINEHKADKAATGSKSEADNILDVLLDIQDQGNFQLPVTTDSIKAIILDLFAGASDTSLMTVEWAMAEMIKSPTVMHKAQEEVRQVFSLSHDKENINEGGLNGLKYLKLVIRETLRLHPPVALIPRESGETTEINGYAICPKTKILVNAWGIGRDSNSWTEPEKFSPERFDDNYSADYKGTHFELIPFGAGKRMCPGIVMAMAIIEPLLVQLLLHFNWELPNGADPQSLDMSDDFGLVVKRKTDLILIPTPFSTLPAK